MAMLFLRFQDPQLVFLILSIFESPYICLTYKAQSF